MYPIIQLSLVLVGVIGFIWIGWGIIRCDLIVPSPVLASLLVLLAIYGVASITSIDPRRSLSATWLVGLYVLVYALIGDLLRRKWPAELFIKSLLIVGGILIAYGLIQLVLWERRWLEISGGEPLVPPVIVRLNPFLTHANMVASFINLLLPLAAVQFLASRSTSGRIALAVYGACAGVVLLFTSSRSGWIAGATGLGLTGLSWLRTTGWLDKVSLKRLRWNLGTVVLALFVSILLVVGVVAVVRVASHPSHGSLLRSRHEFWGPAWRAFTEAPLLGTGPDTYATSYLQDSSVPPRGLFVRAHSVVLHMASETGIAGLVAALCVVVVAVREALRRWREAIQSSERLMLAGLMGSLLSFAVHSLFDTPPAVPSIALTAILLLAVLEHPFRPLALGLESRRWSQIGLAVIWIALVGLGVWMQRAYRSSLEGTALANGGSPAAAAPFLDQAVDRDPTHAIYNLQAGYVYGLLADDEDQGDSAAALEAAISYMQSGISREPAYALNHANLASLYWTRGEKEEAVREMSKASELAPQEATFSLNLGTYLEELGRDEDALAAYRSTLELRPRWANAYFWRSTPLRQQAFESWMATRPESEPTSALALEKAIRQRPDRAGPRVDWAVELIEEQRYTDARRELETALLIGDLEPDVKVRARFLQAELDYREGDIDAAIASAEDALRQVKSRSIFGPGTYGHGQYAWGIFYRMGLAADMLPQLMTISYTDDVVARLMLLVEWYREINDPAAADALVQTLKVVSPDAVVEIE
jgi:O-antigen ligase/Tfp pilus assembly protein PilF